MRYEGIVSESTSDGEKTRFKLIDVIPKSYFQLTARFLFFWGGNFIFSRGYLDPVHPKDFSVNHESKDKDDVALEGWSRAVKEVLKITLTLFKDT